MVALLTALYPYRTARDEVHKDACIQNCGLIVPLQHDLPLFPRCCTDDQSTVFHRSGMKMLLGHVEHKHILCLELVLRSNPRSLVGRLRRSFHMGLVFTLSVEHSFATKLP